MICFVCVGCSPIHSNTSLNRPSRKSKPVELYSKNKPRIKKTIARFTQTHGFKTFDIHIIIVRENKKKTYTHIRATKKQTHISYLHTDLNEWKKNVLLCGIVLFYSCEVSEMQNTWSYSNQTDCFRSMLKLLV